MYNLVDKCIVLQVLNNILFNMISTPNMTLFKMNTISFISYRIDSLCLDIQVLYATVFAVHQRHFITRLCAENHFLFLFTKLLFLST